MVPVVSIVGVSGSGKTTLLEKVVAELVKRGLKVGVLKHDAHGFDIDCEGKDSWRHKKAGAFVVALSSPDKVAVIRDVKKEWPPERVISSYLLEADVVITEGYKGGPFPKIEVVRKANSSTPVCARDKNLVAFVSDVKLKARVPLYGLKDFKKVADLIERRVIKAAGAEGASLFADGKEVALKPFIERLLREAVTGMIKSLKGCEDPLEIELRIKNR